MEQPEIDIEKKSAVRVKLIMWCIVAALILVAPALALRGDYGMVLFVTIPFSVGVMTALIASFNKKRKASTLLLYSLIPAGVSAVAFLLIAREGFICILMALPITIGPLLGGAGVGYAIQNHYWSKYVGMILIFILNTAAYVKEIPEPEFDVIQVQDEIVIDAAPAEIWKQLTQRFEFGNADNFFLANGVSFPQSMELQSENNCNSLSCQYNNGLITATVDSLVPERLMLFSFHEPPVSMKETSLYADVEPHHIRGRILIDYGSFTLLEKSNGQTVLIATTQFRTNIGPRFYWRWWSSYLMQQTHLHVLEKIKAAAEK